MTAAAVIQVQARRRSNAAGSHPMRRREHYRGTRRTQRAQHIAANLAEFGEDL